MGRKRPLWVPFSVIVMGLLLFLFAAAGEFEIGGLSLSVETRIAQLLLSAMGIGLLAAGVLMLADEQKDGDRRAGRKQARPLVDYGIKMLRPTRFQRKMVVEGGYLNKPPDGKLRLFTATEDGRFRPQSIVIFDEKMRRWTGEVDLGPGPYYSVYVVAALIDRPAAILWDYFYQVGRKTDWEPIAGSMRDYAVECDRFLVEGTISA
jgi:hypothetical protein